MITDEAKIGCIPLQQCIDLAMSELDDANGLLEAKLKPFAYECLKKFSRDSAKQPKTVVLPMSDIKTVTLPLDFIAYSKIGTLVGDKIKVFSINNSLANFNLEQSQTFLPPQKLPLSETINSVYNYAFVNAQNYNRQTLYGVGIGHDNWQEARVDLEAGCIRFSATVHAQDIILEFILTLKPLVFKPLIK
jgi:hypothetical protein